MGSLTDYGENATLKHLTKEAAYTPAATIYLALATSSPGETATGASMNEVANSGSYARTAITFGAAASRRVTQNATVTFPQATGSWGTVTHWAVVDSATYGAGNVLAYGAFGTSKSIVSGNTPSVASGEVYVEFTAGAGFANYFANGFLDRMFRNQALTIAATYIGLSTAVVGDTGSVTEPSGNAYARQVINANGGASPAWGAVSAGAVSNANAVTFTQASGSWGTVVYSFLADAVSAGNVMAYGDVTDNAVASGDTVSFASSAIALSLS